jgi:hypothetical protein
MANVPIELVLLPMAPFGINQRTPNSRKVATGWLEALARSSCEGLKFDHSLGPWGATMMNCRLRLVALRFTHIGLSWPYHRLFRLRSIVRSFFFFSFLFHH